MSKQNRFKQYGIILLSTLTLSTLALQSDANAAKSTSEPAVLFVKNKKAIKISYHSLHGEVYKNKKFTIIKSKRAKSYYPKNHKLTAKRFKIVTYRGVKRTYALVKDAS